MQTIWKFKLEIGATTLRMPNSSEVLSVQIQKGELCLWARVYRDMEDMELEVREFEVYGTGHELHNHSNLKFIATFQDLHGDFVGHVFERIPTSRL